MLIVASCNYSNLSLVPIPFMVYTQLSMFFYFLLIIKQKHPGENLSMIFNDL